MLVGKRSHQPPRAYNLLVDTSDFNLRLISNVAKTATAVVQANNFGALLCLVGKSTDTVAFPTVDTFKLSHKSCWLNDILHVTIVRRIKLGFERPFGNYCGKLEAFKTSFLDFVSLSQIVFTKLTRTKCHEVNVKLKELWKHSDKNVKTSKTLV